MILFGISHFYVFGKSVVYGRYSQAVANRLTIYGPS